MKNAPCVRFASRINPKIRENPDDSKNNSPPSDRLLRPWMIQNCIVSRFCSCLVRYGMERCSAYGSRFLAGG